MLGNKGDEDKEIKLATSKKQAVSGGKGEGRMEEDRQERMRKSDDENMRER